jgi:RNA polymerase sigma-70 factor (ECF subfamily)
VVYYSGIIGFMHLVADEKNWFKEIFDEHHNYIRNYLYYLSGDPDLSDDLVQDTFVKLWEIREKVKTESVLPFLFTIARHLYFKSHRRKAVHLKFFTNWEEQAKEVSGEYILEMKEFDKKLQQSLAQLPEKTRTAFLLSRIDEMSYSEIAINFGLSIKAIEKHISKAKRILREQIGHNL